MLAYRWTCSINCRDGAGRTFSRMNTQVPRSASAACVAATQWHPAPGYSISDGAQASEELVLLAMEAALAYVSGHRIPPRATFLSSFRGSSVAESDERDDGDVAPEPKRAPLDRVVIFGRSLGTGPSVHIAAKVRGLAGVVLQSPLESGARCIMGPVPAALQSACTVLVDCVPCAVGRTGSLLVYPLDIFRNYEHIAKLDCPVLIMHGAHEFGRVSLSWLLTTTRSGERDGVVPCASGRALSNALASRPNVIRLNLCCGAHI
jgi:hypothetical protein